MVRTEASKTRPFKWAGSLSRNIVLAAILLLASVTVAVSVGAVPVPASTVWGVVLNKLSPDLIEATWSKGRTAIVWDIRFPRALLALMVGAGLAAVGASLQAVTRRG